jgi:hypothetical protein
MTISSQSAGALVGSGRLAHVVTLNEDGSPQVSCGRSQWTATIIEGVTPDLVR